MAVLTFEISFNASVDRGYLVGYHVRRNRRTSYLLEDVMVFCS